jgi:hypothetical protein
MMLQRDLLADFAKQVEGQQQDDLLIFNPLPWPRRISGEIPQPVLSPRGTPQDETAGRHFQDRMYGRDTVALAVEGIRSFAGDARLWLKPVEVPGFGYTVVRRADLVEWRPAAIPGQEAVVESKKYRLVFDLQQGGLQSWQDMETGQEWVDQQTSYRFNGFVHERVADTTAEWPRSLMFSMAHHYALVERPRGWKPGWPAERNSIVKILQHQVYRTPLGKRVIQKLEAPGIAVPLYQSIFLPDFEDYVEFESWWEMGSETHPEATYILYPFNLVSPEARLDLGGQAVHLEHDQLPQVCRDYYTAQYWVDFSSGDRGVTIALPENPMVQFGGFHFGDNQERVTLERALLLGWVTNNYWETNFRAHQPGRVRALYRVLPYQGSYDENRSHRFGLEAANDRLLLQHMGERPAVHLARFPESGSLLELPESLNPGGPVLTLHVKPAMRQTGVILRLLNASDEEQIAEVRSGLLKIASARLCDPLENPLESASVRDGKISLRLLPRRMATLILEVG